ncbi:MAG: histone deacetylase, partial [Phycisphaerales bacterium JB038]
HPFYPGTGKANETGTGDGLGTTWNLPTPIGTTRRAILDHFRHELEAAAEKMKPQLILISAGFDAHAEDPLAQCEMTTDGYEELSRVLLQLAEDVCEGRAVSMLEGGYHLTAAAQSLARHVKVLLEYGERA